MQFSKKIKNNFLLKKQNTFVFLKMDTSLNRINQKFAIYIILKMSLLNSAG